MTTSSPILGLLLYNSTTDQAEFFADFRAAIAGDVTTSNFYKIDTEIGNIQSDIANLETTRGAFSVSATYSAPNTYVASVSGITAYTSGMSIMLTVDTTTSGSVTLNINSLGAKSLMKVNASGTAINLTGSDLNKGGYYLFRYDGTRWLWVSANTADQINIVGTSGNLVTVGSDNKLLGTTTPASSLASTTNAATSKSTPVDADEIPLADSAASYGLKKLTWANIKATAKAYYDTVYAALAGSASQVFSVGAATAIAHAPRADQIQTQGIVGYTTGGTSTAFTLTTFATGVALTTNERWHVTFHSGAGVAPTLNRDSKGAKALKYYNSSGTKVACGSSTIFTNMKADVVYDGTDYVLITGASTFDGPSSSTNGNLVFWDGTSGKVVQDNSQGYEAVTTFSPIIEGSTSAGTATYTTQLGSYMRIGSMVAGTITLVWTGHTGTGNMQVANLPYTSANNGIITPVTISWSAITLSGTDYKLLGIIASNSNRINLQEIASGAVTNLPMDAAGTLRISFVYFI